MRMRIQVERTITLRDTIEVECTSEDVLDNALDNIENNRIENMDDLIDSLNRFGGIEVTKYIEDGSGDVEISIEDTYKI